MRGGEPGASAAGASAAGASGTGADGAEGEKNDLKPEGRKMSKNVEKTIKIDENGQKCWKNGKKIGYNGIYFLC